MTSNSRTPQAMFDNFGCIVKITAHHAKKIHLCSAEPDNI